MNVNKTIGLSKTVERKTHSPLPCTDLLDEFWARNGFDLTIPEATAGSGCLVGHSKRRGKTETITSWKSGLARTARLLSQPNNREPEKHGCSLVLHSVAASKTQPSAVRNLLAGGGRNRAPLKACKSVVMESSKTRVQFPPRPPFEQAGNCLCSELRRAHDVRTLRLPAAHSSNTKLRHDV